MRKLTAVCAVVVAVLAAPTASTASAQATPLGPDDAPSHQFPRLAVPVVVGGLYGVVKGVQACRKLERVFVLRPIARACKDFYERKFIKLVAKIVGVKTPTALFTCSETLPRKTNPVVQSLAKMVCG